MFLKRTCNADLTGTHVLRESWRRGISCLNHLHLQFFFVAYTEFSIMLALLSLFTLQRYQYHSSSYCLPKGFEYAERASPSEYDKQCSRGTATFPDSTPVGNNNFKSVISLWCEIERQKCQYNLEFSGGNKEELKMEMVQQQIRPAAAAPALPQELIVEILSWVPVKSLMRFRCVSKSWNSLIFDPTLVKLHLQRSCKNPHVLLRCNDNIDEDEFWGEDTVSTCSVRGLLENPSFTVDDGSHTKDKNYLLVGSCNGLVCLITSFDGDGFTEYRVRFWNLTTRIMSEDSPQLSLHSFDYKLRFNSFKYGFGYDEWSDTYKVVMVLFNVKSENWEVKVHCLGDTCWKSILTCPAFPFLGEADGQLVNGAVNWRAICKLGLDYQCETITVNQLVIFSYDIHKETFKYLLMPNGLSDVPDYPNLGVLKGCLSLYYDHKETHFVVWIMREFGDEKSWSQLLNVT